MASHCSKILFAAELDVHPPLAALDVVVGLALRVQVGGAGLQVRGLVVAVPELRPVPICIKRFV